MPLPEFPESGDLSRQEVINLYEDSGWYKKFTYEWIEVNQRTGQIMRKRYEVNADTLPCKGECVQYMLTFVQMRPTGVVWTCGVCRKTDGPMAQETGRLLNPPMGDPVSVGEAWETLRRTGQKPPVGLRPIRGTEGLRITP